MGREIKRVKLDFNWPINKTWEGYLNPFSELSISCDHCTGNGMSKFANELHNKWYGYIPFKPEDNGSVPFNPTDPCIFQHALHNISYSTNGLPIKEELRNFLINEEAVRLSTLFNESWSHHLNSDDIQALVNEGRLMDFTSTWISESGWVRKNPPYVPTVKEVNDWSIRGMGHDSINSWICIKSACQRNNKPWVCSQCEGQAYHWPSKHVEKQNNEWKPAEPPKGKGYQLWETVSEGSPISPVFAKADELATWLVNAREYKWKKNDAEMTFDKWMKFILGNGWAPSVISMNGKVQTGVDFITSK